MVSIQHTRDFMILGPTMASGAKVLNALYSLYYLPDNYKLILTGSKDADQSFYKRIVALVEGDGLSHRVSFTDNVDNPGAVILPNTGMSRANNAVSGDSPEAIASAILDLARG